MDSRRLRSDSTLSERNLPLWTRPRLRLIFDGRKLEEARDTLRGEVVVCEGVALTDVAARVGTPAYVYSRAAIRGCAGGVASWTGGSCRTRCVLR